MTSQVLKLGGQIDRKRKTTLLNSGRQIRFQFFTIYIPYDVYKQLVLTATIFYNGRSRNSQNRGANPRLGCANLHLLFGKNLAENGMKLKENRPKRGIIRGSAAVIRQANFMIFHCFAACVTTLSLLNRPLDGVGVSRHIYGNYS